MKAKALEAGRFAGEYLYSLVPTDQKGMEAKDRCGSFLVMCWNRGSVTLEQVDDDKFYNYTNYIIDAGTTKDTAILCTQRTSAPEEEIDEIWLSIK